MLQPCYGFVSSMLRVTHSPKGGEGGGSLRFEVFCGLEFRTKGNSLIPLMRLLLVTPQNPWTGVCGAAAGIGLCSWLALQGNSVSRWHPFFTETSTLWLVVGLLFLLMGLIDQCLFKRAFPRRNVRPAFHHGALNLLRSAFWRFVALLLVLGVSYGIYFLHPLYQSDFYLPFREFFPILFKLFLILGFPYILVTLRWKSSLSAEFLDPGLSLILWGRTLYRGSLGWRKRRFRCGILKEAEK